MIGGEHRAERRGHAIEALFPERQLLCVGLDPLDLDASLGGAALRVPEQLGRHVAAYDVAPRSAAGIATVPPLPVPTSSRSIPGPTPILSSTSAPTGSTTLEKLSQSPAAHVARAR